MTALDVADLVVIGGRVLGIGTGAALEQVDTQAAETALAEAPVAPSLPESYAAAAACAHLMSGLLRHPPFPEHREARPGTRAANLRPLTSVRGRRSQANPAM